MSIAKEISIRLESAALAAAVNVNHRMPDVLQEPNQVQHYRENSRPGVDTTHRNTSRRPNQTGPHS